MDDVWGTGTQDSGPPLSAEAVAAAERGIGLRLPTSYAGLFRTRNGG